jgi:hypothetical protein
MARAFLFCVPPDAALRAHGTVVILLFGTLHDT